VQKRIVTSKTQVASSKIYIEIRF